MAASQIRAVSSSLPVARRVPSGEKATLLTLPSCPAAISAPVAASQIRAMPPAGGRAVGGEGDAIDPVLMPRDPRSPHSVRSQIRSGLVIAPVASRVPSGEKATLLTQSSCPANPGDLRTRCGVPDPGGAVIAPGGEPRAVGGEGDAIDQVLMPRHPGDLRARGRVPDPGGARHRSRWRAACRRGRRRRS